VSPFGIKILLVLVCDFEISHDVKIELKSGHKILVMSELCKGRIISPVGLGALSCPQFFISSLILDRVRKS
jgi:hypothetical protein